jgi:hypothetical protein
MQVDIPEDMETQMTVQLAQFRTAIGKEHPSRRERRFGRFALAGIIVAACLALVFFLPKLDSGSPYAAAAAQLRQAQSLQYTFELAPGASIEFTQLKPKYFSARMSWGMEVRSDGSGRKLLLIHTMHKYAFEKAAPGEFADQMKMLTMLRELPAKASDIIGKRKAGAHNLIGYRIGGSAVAGASDLKELDVWVDEETRSPDRADFVFQVPGKPLYEMHVQNIRADATIDPAMFSLTPPAGYTALPGNAGIR